MTCGEIDFACTRCRLSKGRTQVVGGTGPCTSRIVFLGEAPGKDEDRKGEPFVGRAGSILERALEEAGVTKRQVYLTNTVKCVDGNTRVRLADGSSMRIDTMVRTRYQGRVLTVNERGVLTTRRIVGWHRSRLDGRRTCRLSTRHSKGSNRGVVGVTLTEDHMVLAKHGWIPASHLSEEDEIATGYPAPDRKSFQVILGTMIGDAHICREAPMLQYSHSVKQMEWAFLKARALASFQPTMTELQHGNQTGRRFWATHVRTRSGPFWRYLREEFYPEGRSKVVPPRLIEELEDLGLATLYGDDGYLRTSGARRPRAQLCTDSFRRTDMLRIESHLKGMGIQCKATKHGIYWNLLFSTKGTEELMERIVPYVPPTMRYKVLPECRDVAFKSSAFSPGVPHVFWDKATITRAEPRRDSAGRPVKTMYCLDVEGTSCFVTPGGVVHNCRPPANRRPRVDEIESCYQFLQSEISDIRPTVICVLGQTAAKTLLKTTKRMQDISGKEIRTDISGNKVLVRFTYHPAACLYQRQRLEEFKQTIKASLKAAKMI